MLVCMRKMHSEFPLHDLTTAPPAAVPTLQATQQAFGFLPNLERSMATAPALLGAYASLWDLFDSTSFTKAERQIVYQTINVEHACNY